MKIKWCDGFNYGYLIRMELFSVFIDRTVVRLFCLPLQWWGCVHRAHTPVTEPHSPAAPDCSCWLKERECLFFFMKVVPVTDFLCGTKEEPLIFPRPTPFLPFNIISRRRTGKPAWVSCSSWEGQLPVHPSWLQAVPCHSPWFSFYFLKLPNPVDWIPFFLPSFPPSLYPPLFPVESPVQPPYGPEMIRWREAG